MKTKVRVRMCHPCKYSMEMYPLFPTPEYFKVNLTQSPRRWTYKVGIMHGMKDEKNPNPFYPIKARSICGLWKIR